jgi:uncharacterized protein (TIGR02757 family)
MALIGNSTSKESLKDLLDFRVSFYETTTFIEADPISVPHRFSKLQDIEISGLFAATLAWGHRSMIIRNAARIVEGMDNAPHDFILHYHESDLKRFLTFVHRTFSATDLLYFIQFLKHHYDEHDSLETAFSTPGYSNPTVRQALEHFHNYFFSLPEFPARTRKHVATPARGSACKRLCMYLRWMVRRGPVDFGLWESINPAELICPLDTHVARVASRLGLLTKEKADWKAAVELTDNLRRLNPHDPVRYDFALFSLGADERF